MKISIIALCIFVFSISTYAEEQKQLTSREPDKTAEYWFNLGKDYYSASKYQESIEALKKAIEFKSDYVEAFLGLGSAYIKLGKYQEAIDSVKQAVRIKPDYALAHFGLGLIYATLHDKDSALKEYEILKGLDRKLANELLKDINKL
jgi:tetratricopeptide (TPR) repeat protein